MYSGKTEDIGNNHDGVEMHAGQFGLHMRFFFDELVRVMKPGSVSCIHLQQLYTTKVQHGYMGIRDFRGSVITLAKNHGFTAHGEFVIAKNPVAFVNRSHKHSLQYITGYDRDSRGLAPMTNDYVLLFRKPGGEGNEIQALYHPDENAKGWVSLDEWQIWATGTWCDILEIDVLDAPAPETKEEKHVCMLQKEVIRRCILMYSAPGQLILDPFMGIGSTSYVAITEGRNAMGFELKESYYRQALKNIELAKQQITQSSDSLPLLAVCGD